MKYCLAIVFGIGVWWIVNDGNILVLAEEAKRGCMISKASHSRIRFDRGIVDKTKSIPSLVWEVFPSDVEIWCSSGDIANMALCGNIRSKIRYLNIINKPSKKGQKLFSELGKFSNLEEIVIEGEGLESVGSEILELSKLKRLRGLCFRVKFTITLPEELYLLPVTKLCISGVGTNSIWLPKGISQMKRLRILKLCNFSSVSLPDDIRNSKIEAMVINSVHLGNEVYGLLPNGLKWLDLSETEVSKVPPRALTARLEGLYLYHCRIQKLPNPWILPKKIREINLARNQIRRIPKIVWPDHTWCDLYLQGNPIESINPEIIQRLGDWWLALIHLDEGVKQRLMEEYRDFSKTKRRETEVP